MSALKQSDATVQISVTHTTSGHRRVLAEKAHPSVIAPERPRAERSPFAEDFTREHSLRRLQITSSEMAGNF